MEKENQQLIGLIKKQKLISLYYEKINKLQIERKLINKKLKAAEDRFAELINSTADVDQLELFDNIDQFLIDVEGNQLNENNENS